MFNLFSVKRYENSCDAGGILKWEVFLKKKLNPWKIKNTIVGLILVRENHLNTTLKGKWEKKSVFLVIFHWFIFTLRETNKKSFVFCLVYQKKQVLWKKHFFGHFLTLFFKTPRGTSCPQRRNSTPFPGGWVPNERMIIVYQLDIGIASKS